MISVNEAKQIILKEIHPLPAEAVPLPGCLHRVLGRDLPARDSLPPFDKSAMDGYAVRSADTAGAEEAHPVKLTVMGLRKAGNGGEIPLGPGSACKIMTGAPLPPGADAVIEAERTRGESGFVLIDGAVPAGRNILFRGEEIRRGETALRKGTLLRPAQIGVLAAQGYAEAPVYRKPSAAVLSTGDELAEVTDPPENGKIRDSNRYLLTALLAEQGAAVRYAGRAADRPRELAARIGSAFESADAVISSGGVSAGDYDFVQEALRLLGADIRFRSVAIKPGKPALFAVLRGKLFFGLPGNPLAAATAFDALVKPALRKLRGLPAEEALLPLVLKEDTDRASLGRTRYWYVRIRTENGTHYAQSAGSQSSGHLMTLSEANGVAILPPGAGPLKKGEIVYGKYFAP